MVEGCSGWVLLATTGPVDDRTGDGDASRFGVVGADGGVWLREVVDGRDTQRDGGCATFPFKVISQFGACGTKTRDP